MNKPTIAVIGGGSWATAIIKILSNNLDKIHWWVRSKDTVEFISKYHHNPNYLSDVQVDAAKVIVSNDLKACIRRADLVILAVPSAFVKSALEGIAPSDFENK